MVKKATRKRISTGALGKTRAGRKSSAASEMSTGAAGSELGTRTRTRRAGKAAKLGGTTGKGRRRRAGSELSEAERLSTRSSAERGSMERGRGRRSMERETRGSVERGGRRRGTTSTGLMPTGFFNRNIFQDPFFTENWEDLFNVPSVNDLMTRARDMTKDMMRSANLSQRRIDTTHPGSYTSKSFYRTTTSGPNRSPHREVISQELITNVDDQGRKYTERWKNLEHDNMLKTQHTKMIGDKGIKEMRSQNKDTGEEYEHIDYRHLNEKDLQNFHSEFDRGLRSVKNIVTALPSGLGTTGMTRGMLPSYSSWDERDIFPEHHHDRFGLPSEEWGTSGRGSEYGRTRGSATSSGDQGRMGTTGTTSSRR